MTKYILIAVAVLIVLLLLFVWRRPKPVSHRARQTPKAVERRHGHRRKGDERRTDIRFELEKDDRRAGKERRKGASDPFEGDRF